MAVGRRGGETNKIFLKLKLLVIMVAMNVWHLQKDSDMSLLSLSQNIKDKNVLSGHYIHAHIHTPIHEKVSFAPQ